MICTAAATLATGCRGVPSLGSYLRPRKEVATAAPAQPHSLRPTTPATDDRSLVDRLIRPTQYQPGLNGPLMSGSPPLPPHTPAIGGGDLPGNAQYIDEPYAPAELSPGGGHYLDRGPAVTGELLARERAVTATERALELSRQLEDARAEKAQLQTLIEELQNKLQDKSDLLNNALKELSNAKDDVARSQKTIDRWATETNALRKRMEEREAAHEKSFNELVELINTMIDQQNAANDNAAAAPSE